MSASISRSMCTKFQAPKVCSELLSATRYTRFATSVLQSTHARGFYSGSSYSPESGSGFENVRFEIKKDKRKIDDVFPEGLDPKEGIDPSEIKFWGALDVPFIPED